MLEEHKARAVNVGSDYDDEDEDLQLLLDQHIEENTFLKEQNIKFQNEHRRMKTEIYMNQQLKNQVGADELMNKGTAQTILDYQEEMRKLQ